MATNFPTSLDSFTNPTASDDLDTVVGGRQHDDFHADINDGMEAVQKRLLGMPLVHLPAAGAVRTSRSFGWKGCIYTPSANLNLWGIRAHLQAPVVSTTLQAAIITVSAGAIATITKTDVLTLDAAGVGGSPLVDFKFASPVAVTSGTPYGLVFGYSSTAGGNTTTTDLPVFVISRAVWEMALPRSGTVGTSVYHIATTNPAVATSVTTAANDQQSGACSYAVGPLFDWA